MSFVVITISFAMIPSECKNQALFKTLHQGSKNIDTQNMWLSLARNYLFTIKLSLFSSKLLLFHNPLQGQGILPPYNLPFVPTHLISKCDFWLMIFSVMSREYKDQVSLKTLQQGSDYIKTYNLWLSLAIRYSFSTKLNLFSSN